MTENIIDILLSQHNTLKKDLTAIKEETEKSQPEFTTIVNDLAKFKNLIVEHLNLENNVFYPKLLEKMQKQGIDTSDTIKFIDAMKGIGNKVEDFLGKYANLESIRNNVGNFKTDLSNITSILILRMTNEEMGVYWRFKDI
ncbi:hypothetical protein HZB04_01975 [Candidatus Wolfebacteria bacterium]|nr:hypothetical protein [Candidatus Wolfebacteria bacterium]